VANLIDEFPGFIATDLHRASSDSDGATGAIRRLL
jgi:hypothetical protein